MGVILSFLESEMCFFFAYLNVKFDKGYLVQKVSDVNIRRVDCATYSAIVLDIALC